MKSNKSALIALLLVQLFYGVTFTFANDVIDGGYMQPYGFILFRVSLAGVLFWILSIWTPSEKIDRKDFPKFIMAAFFGVAWMVFARLVRRSLSLSRAGKAAQLGSSAKSTLFEPLLIHL